MEIHAPHGAIRSLKEFFLHIFIVTVGILIALSLEGLREARHEHRLVHDARSSFRTELLANQKNLNLELTNIKQQKQIIANILNDLPQLEKDPKEFAARVSKVQPSFYYFATTSWESALSSGALTHMDRSETDRLAAAYLQTRSYQEIEKEALPVWFSLESYFQRRRSFGPHELSDGIEKLQMMALYELTMEHVGNELSGGLRDALN